ncbi:MAG: YbaK/EbsC family protein [Campylobacter sp.]
MPPLLVPYGKRANTNAVVKRHLDAAKVSFADLGYITKTTGMEFGSITPIGLPKDWLILADKSLLKQKYLVVGGGLVKSKLLLASHLLAGLPNAKILEGLARD